MRTALTRVSAERAARVLFGIAIVAIGVLTGCGGGSSSGSPESVSNPVSVSVSPTTATVQVGLTQTFTATLVNDTANKGVTWALSGAGCSGTACGTLSAASSLSGAAIAYTAPTAVPSPASITLTATSVADGTKTATAAITVAASATPIAVTLSKSTASVQVSGSTTFSANVANDSANKGVSWALSGAGCSGATCGAVTPATSASGVNVTYTAPASAPTPPTVTLTATSVSDGTKSASATITLTAAPPPAITVTLSQTTAGVVVGATQNFTATVANDSANQGVTWTLSGAGCSGATCGTVAPAASASGVAVTYAAPVSVPVPPGVTLTATSVTDNTKSASAAITITTSGNAVSVALTPQLGGLALGQSLNFTATVTNDVAAAGVTWTASAGTFSAQTSTTATYVAPNSPGSGITVTAMSVADSTKSATATLGVTDLAGVTTYHNDLSRDGANVQEYALNTTTVATATFGKLFSCTVDGAVYAQPLWVPNVSIGGGTHNVIVVATQRDWVYVFDADANPCTMYWGNQYIPSGETYVNNVDFTTNGVDTEDIYPDIGITGTPVIDPSTNTIYVVTKTKNTGTTTAHSRLHALSLAAGTEATNSPVEISATVTGNCDGGTTVSFNPLMQNQRPGLALLNGEVYVGWGSHGDVGNWHGWLMGFQTANLTAAPTVFLTTPNGLTPPVGGNAPPCGGGIWMSGGAPAIDENNNLYALTGNGAWDGNSDFGDSYVRLSTPGLSEMDYFTPSNQATLDEDDTDVGSSGTAVLIDQTNGPVPHLLVGASKGSIFFVINRDNMSGFNAGGDQVVQEFTLDGHSFSTPGFWNNTAYFFGVVFGSTLAGETFAFNTGSGQFSSTATNHTPSTFGFPGATPSISASSATTDGIVWAINAAAYGTSDNGPALAGPAILHAYDASNVSTELWNSSQASGGRDTAGNAVKFTVPTVANGKVYIGTRGSDNTEGGGTTTGELDVYGLLPN
jgi:hypothetical protein